MSLFFHDFMIVTCAKVELENLKAMHLTLQSTIGLTQKIEICAILRRHNAS